jgi:hypothetical protein
MHTVNIYLINCIEYFTIVGFPHRVFLPTEKQLPASKDRGHTLERRTCLLATYRLVKFNTICFGCVEKFFSHKLLISVKTLHVLEVCTK